MRRCDRKKLDQFYRDHVWSWAPPMKLRKIRYTNADIDRLIALRSVYIEAGRQRMIARGLKQYALPGELCRCGSKEKSLKLYWREDSDGNVWVCPTCKMIISVSSECTYTKEGEYWTEKS